MENRVVNTKSLQTASFIVARGHKVLKTIRDKNSTLFCFLDTPVLASDVESLRYGDDLVSAKKLFDARSYLLTLIHDDGDLG